MTLQREPGKSHEPMRPRLITLDMASGHNAFLDSGGSVDWSTTGGADSRLPIRQLNKYLDKPQGVLSVVTESVVVPRGLWKARLCVEVSNNDASARSVGFAITNAAGTTVHREWDDFEFHPHDGRMTVAFETLVKVTAATDTITFRAARRVGGATVTIQPEYVGYVQKVANHGEAREV